MRTSFGASMVASLLLLTAQLAQANRDDPMAEPGAPESTSAESRVNEGQRLSDGNDWKGAEAAFREAISLSPTVAQAWNGLGYSLRKQKQYEEAVKSYQEALRLKPDYPEALEYLGEAYVEMGKLDEAKRVLERLRPLDADEADELEETIAKRAKR